MINIKKENEAIHELFLSHDVDGSGDLPVSELVALLTELDGEEPSESDVEYVLAQVVVDGEGESRAIKESQLKPALACWYLTHGESEIKPLQVSIVVRPGHWPRDHTPSAVPTCRPSAAPQPPLASAPARSRRLDSSRCRCLGLTPTYTFRRSSSRAGVVRARARRRT